VVIMDLDRYLKMMEKNVKYGEIRLMRLRVMSLVMKNGVLSGIDKTDEEGIAIRVLDKNFSFVSTSKIDDENIKRAIEKAIKIAKSGERRDVKISDEEIVKDTWSVPQKKNIEDYSLEDKVSILNGIEGVLVKENVPMRFQSLREKIEDIEFYSTEGSEIKGHKPSIFYFYMMGVLEDGNFEQGSQEFGKSGGYEAFDEWDLENAIAEESKKLKVIAKSRKSPEGKMDLVVGPEVSGIVAHESSGHPSESDRILGREAAQAGESFIKVNMIGERVGSDVVSVIDDPTIDGSFGYYKYDFEGVRARKRYLYKNGRINEFLLNREFAGMLGMKSNAAARSSWWDKEPIVRMSTTYIEPGDHTLEELIEGVKLGIFMNSFTEWNIDDIRIMKNT